MFTISFLITVLGSVLYHICQKTISPSVNPVISLMVTYVVALAISVPLLALFPLKGSLTESLSKVNWASVALAFAIVGLEVGFLLAYRAGWDLSLMAIATNASAALLLLPIGVTFLKEKPSTTNIVGVFICVIGLAMVNLRK